MAQSDEKDLALLLAGVAIVGGAALLAATAWQANAEEQRKFFELLARKLEHRRMEFVSATFARVANGDGVWKVTYTNPWGVARLYKHRFDAALAPYSDAVAGQVAAAIPA